MDLLMTSKPNNPIVIDDVIKEIKTYFPEAETSAILKAYQFAKTCHEGQTRKSGEPYIYHPMHVALILCELRMDVVSICAALLHDVVEDCKITKEDLAKEFGDKVTSLVDGVTKIGRIP